MVVEQEAGLQDDIRVLPQVVVKGGTIHQIKTIQKRGDCLWVLQEELSSRISVHRLIMSEDQVHYVNLEGMGM